MHRRLWIAVVLVILLGTWMIPSHASAGALSLTNRLIRWEGEVSSSTAPDFSECQSSPCAEFQFDVDIPSAHWDAQRGGVEISVRWATAGDFDLYVLDGSDIVGSSTGTFSNAEGVVVPDLPSGGYRAIVVARSSERPPFEGIVQVEDTAEPEPQKTLLPNLRPLRPTELRISTPMSQAPFPADPYKDPDHFSCYRSEAEETGAARCLRFTTTTVNEGKGALRLRVRRDEGETLYRTYQVIERADGTEVERLAGVYEFHNEHGHFHYDNFVRHRLYRVRGVDRERVGKAARGLKVGFCIIDGLNHRWDREGNASREFSWACNEVPPGQSQDSGISAGWGDRYYWFFVDQYVDVTGVRNGTYELEIITDFSKTIRESNETDNSRSIFFHLRGDSVTVFKK